jgi:hypothetical protein
MLIINCIFSYVTFCVVLNKNPILPLDTMNLVSFLLPLTQLLTLFDTESFFDQDCVIAVVWIPSK